MRIKTASLFVCFVKLLCIPFTLLITSLCYDILSGFSFTTPPGYELTNQLAKQTKKNGIYNFFLYGVVWELRRRRRRVVAENLK